MFIRNVTRFMIVALAVSGLAAQTSSVTGPVTGLVFDAHARAIRPMLGIPGASYLGDPLADAIDLASVSPDGRLAVAATDAGLFLLRGLETGSPVWVRLAAAGNPELIAWNRTSTAVATYSGGYLRLWTRLKETLEVSRALRSGRRASLRERRVGLRLPPMAKDLGDVSVLGGRVTALAVDGSAAVLIGIEDAVSGGVYRLASEGDAVLLARAASPSSIVLANSGRDLFVTDRDRQEVLEVRNFRDGADVIMFANESLGVSDPVAAALSRDARTLLVASGSGRCLARYDLQSRALIDQMELDFEPSRLEPLGDGSVFLLNSRGGRNGVLRVLEEGPNPAVFFVPAAGAAAVAEVNPVEE